MGNKKAALSGKFMVLTAHTKNSERPQTSPEGLQKARMSNAQKQKMEKHNENRAKISKIKNYSKSMKWRIGPLKR